MENRFRCKRIEVPFELSLKEWLREKESNLHLRVQSPTCCRLHHPAETGHGEREMGRRGEKAGSRVPISPRPRFSPSPCPAWSGHWDSNPDPRANLALKPLIR